VLIVIGILRQPMMVIFNVIKIKNGADGKDAENCPIGEYKQA